MMRRPSAKLAFTARLLGATALSSLLPYGALAQSTAVVATDTGTRVYSSANGTTVVNIAAPNAAGVSHNRFDQYNVPANGVVLNNGGLDQQQRQSQLAGAVAGNSNITGAQASVIINEVVKANPSTLAGYTEIVGGRADLVVANPWGVTCSGCGFINTAHLVLSTGVPQLSADGRLSGLRTTDGLLTITGKGLDASATDTLALVARSVRIDGQVNAKTLDVVGGATSYDTGTGEVVVIAGTADKPQYAIDASALGSMYAGRIRLIATEAGVGVRALGNVGATAGDLSITAGGNIVIGGQASASAAVAVSAGGDLTLDHARLASGTALGLDALVGKLTLTGGQINAGSTMTLRAASLSDTGGSGVGTDTNRRDAAGSLVFQIAGGAGFAGVVWSGGTASLTAGDTVFTNSSLAADVATLRTASLLLDLGGILGKTLDIGTRGALSLTQGGYLQAQNALTASGATITNAGRISAGADPVRLSGAVTNGGVIQGYGVVDIQAGSTAIVNTGTITAGSLTLAGGALTNSGQAQAVNGATVTATSLTNSGTLTGSTTAANGLSITAPAIANTGTIQSAGLTAITATVRVDNGGALYGNDLSLMSGSVANGGTVQALAGATLKGGSYVNSGVIQAGTGLTMIADSLGNSGTLTGGTGDAGQETLTLGTLQVAAGGVLRSAGMLTVVSSGSQAIAGSVIGQKALSLGAAGPIALTGAALVGTTGIVTISAGGTGLSLESGASIAGGSAALGVAGLQNAGTLQTDGAFALDAGSGTFTNTGTLRIGGGATLKAGTIGDGGTISVAGDLGLTANILTIGAQGSLGTQGALSATIGGLFDNAGTLIAAGALSINGTATSIGNTGYLQGGTTTIVAANAAIANGPTATGGGQIVLDSLTLSAGSLVNAGTIQSIKAADMRLAGAFTNAATGLVNAQGTFSLAAARLVNVGQLQALGGLTATVGQDLNNSGTLIAAGAAGQRATLTTGTLANSGTLASYGSLDIRQATGFASTGTLAAAGDLSLHGDTSGTLTLDGIVQSGGTTSIDAGSARIVGARGLQLVGNDVRIAAASFDNAGVIQANRNLTLTSSAAFLNEATGTLNALGTALFTLAGATNAGQIQSGSGVTWTSGDFIDTGLFIASTNPSSRAVFSTGALTIGTQGRLQAAGALDVTLGGALTNSAILVAGGDLTLAAAGGSPLSIVSNAGSTLEADGLLTVNAPATDIAIGNGATWIAGQANLTLGSLAIGTGGILQANGAATILLGRDLTVGGTLYAKGALSVGANAITDTGLIQGSSLALTAQQGLVNQGGYLVAADAVASSTITAATLTNGGGGNTGIEAAGNLRVAINGSLANTGLILASGNLTLAGTGLAIMNAAGATLRAGATLDITAAGTVFTSQAGNIFGQQLSIALGGGLANTGQIVGLGGTNSISVGGTLANASGGLIYFGHTADPTDQLSTLTAASLLNGGTIQADRYLTLFANSFTNTATLTSADTLDFRFTGADASSAGGSLTNTGLIRATTLNIGLDRPDTAALPTIHFVNVGYNPLITNSGRIDGQALILRGTIVNNANAVVLGSTSLATISDTLTNYGLIGSQGDYELSATTVGNRAGAGIAAGGRLLIDGARTASNATFVNDGSVFATNIAATIDALTNNAGATLDASNSAAFVDHSFTNHGAVTAGTGLQITADVLTNDVGYVQIDTDQPSYFDPNWNDSSGAATNADSIHNRGDLYHQGRLEVENPDGTITAFAHRTQGDVYSIDNDTNGYNYAYYFTQTIHNPGSIVKPTLISNGDLSLTFNQGINRGGVISASNALTLNGQGSNATFTIDNVAAYKTYWASSWDDYCNNGCTVFRSYEQHVTQKVSNGSVGASIAATTIDGGQGNGAFALVIDGTNQGGGVSAVPKGSPAAGTFTPVGLTNGAAVTPVSAPGATTMIATGTAAVSATRVAAVASSGGGSITAVTAGIVPQVSVGATGGVGVAAVVASNYDAGIKGSASGTPSISFGTTTVTLPTSPSGRFVPTNDPSTNYLIESNPLFTGADSVGSDLLVRLLGLDPDGLIRRLGDASYENYLIHQQLIDGIGTNLITRGLTEAQQTEALMRSASSQAKSLGLTYGQALSVDQQANLKTDLVWMVATQVNGQTVLAPVVYLSAATRNAFDKGDATIAANYVNLALTSLVNNGGTLKGSTLLSVDATGSITNTSGRISGGTVLLTAGGDITNQTFNRFGGNDRSGSTQTGETGSITATSGLLMKAGGDIKNLGATIFSGGPTALIAGKSVTIDTIVDKRASSTSGTETSSATNGSSNVRVNGDLYTSAGTDVTIGGSKVSVSGMTDIEAGRDVNIVSRADTTSKTTHETGGNLFHRTSTDTTETTTTSQGASMSTGDLYVKSGRDTNVQGSKITTTGDAAFDVGRNMNVLADTDKTTKSVSTRDTGLGVGDALFGDRQKESYDETGKSVGSSINIGGNGTVVAKGDLNLTGSTLHTDGNLSGHVGNLNVTDASDYTLHTEKETLTTVLGGSAGGSVGGSAGGQAGGYAGGHSGGVDASATGGVGAQVGGGHAATTGIVASTDVSSYNARGAIDPKLADEKDGDLRPAGSSIANGVASTGQINALQASGAFDAAADGGDKMKQGQTGANAAGFALSGQASGSVNGNVGVTLAQSQTTSSRDYSSTSVGSELSAGGTLTVIADNAMTIKGSQVKAGADALLAARTITVTTGQNVEEHSRDSMTTGVGVFVGSNNTASIGAEAKGSVGTTGTQQFTNGRDINSSGGGVGTGGNLGETGGSVSASVNVQGASNNDVDLAHNIQTSDSSRNVTNQASSIAAGGKLTMIATDKLSVTGSDLSGDAGVGLRAKNMEFLAAQDTATSSSSNRTTALGFFAGGDAGATAGASAGADSTSKSGAAGASASATGEVGAGVQARNAMDMTSSSTSTARVSSITSKDGTIVRVADNDITDVGTAIKAGKDVLQQSTTFTSKAAQNSSSASAATFVDRVRSGVYAEAGTGVGSDASAQSGAGSQQATASASKTGGASAGVESSLLHSDQQNSNGNATAVVSTIDAGGKFVSVTTGKTSLEGTQLKSGGDLTIAAGALDFMAAKDTKTTSGLANSLSTKVQLGVDAEKAAAGYGEATYTGSGSNGTETTSHAGTADAGGKLTIVSQGKTNLEGTQLSSGGDMTVYSKDDLNFSAVHDTKSGTEHEQSLGVSASFAGKRGENIAGKVEVGVGVTNEDTATAGSMTSGGKLVVVSDKNATFQGTTIKGAGTTAIVAAGDLTIGTADSTKDNYEASVGLGASASRAGETSATGNAAATGAGTNASTAATKPVIGTRGTATAQPAAAATTTTSSTLLARSNEDQQFGTEASASFGMEKSTTRQAGSVTSTGGDVVLKSGGDMTLAGTAVKAAGTAALDAGNNLTFGTADSSSITVNAGVDLMGTRGSPGGVGTHVLDSSASVSTEGKGANTSNASGTQANQNAALQQSAGASEDTKLHGGAGVSASGAYTSTQDAGSISGTNVVTRSGGNTTFVGTDIDATKNASITAGGNVDFKTATNVSVDASFGGSVEGEGHAGSKIGGNTATNAAGTTTTPAVAGAAATPAKPSTWSSASKPTAKDPTNLTGGQAGTSAAAATVAPTQLASGAAGALVASSVPKEDKPEARGGVTDMGVGVGVTNKGSTVNAQTLPINSGGKVSMNGTTGDVGASAINAVNGVDRITTGLASAEIGMTRLGGSVDVQKADLGANGSTTTGAGARGAVQAGLAAVTPTGGLTGDARGAAVGDAASVGGSVPVMTTPVPARPGAVQGISALTATGPSTGIGTTPAGIAAIVLQPSALATGPVTSHVAPNIAPATVTIAQAPAASVAPIAPIAAGTPTPVTPPIAPGLAPRALAETGGGVTLPAAAVVNTPVAPAMAPPNTVSPSVPVSPGISGSAAPTAPGLSVAHGAPALVASVGVPKGAPGIVQGAPGNVAVPPSATATAIMPTPAGTAPSVGSQLVITYPSSAVPNETAVPATPLMAPVIAPRATPPVTPIVNGASPAPVVSTTNPSTDRNALTPPSRPTQTTVQRPVGNVPPLGDGGQPAVPSVTVTYASPAASRALPAGSSPASTIDRAEAPAAPASAAAAPSSGTEDRAAKAETITRQTQLTSGAAVTTPFGQIAIRLSDQAARWTMAGSTLRTKVDVSAVPQGKRPRLLLPDGTWAPEWFVLDRDTGIVSGTVPRSEGDAKAYLAKIRVGAR